MSYVGLVSYLSSTFSRTRCHFYSEDFGCRAREYERGTEEIKEKNDIHPCWKDTPRRDGPRFWDIIVGWNESVTGDFEEKPYYAVDKYVRDDTGDYAVCNTVGRNF
jgi:hypothetical protein